MSDLPGAVQFLFGMLVLGMIGYAIGRARSQNSLYSFLLGALLGPLGWLLILVSKPDESITRQCPACMGRVPRAATACRHCGRELPTPGPVLADAPPSRSDNVVLYGLIVGTVGVIGFVSWIFLG